MRVSQGSLRTGQKITACTIAIVIANSCCTAMAVDKGIHHEPATPKVVYREGYVQGFATGHTFILHENETGYQEVQTLYLGALSASESIQKYPANKNVNRQIKIFMREPYYVVLGEAPILITDIGLVIPSGMRAKPYLVLNRELQLYPGSENESFDLLLRWAKGRGY